MFVNRKYLIFVGVLILSSLACGLANGIVGGGEDGSQAGNAGVSGEDDAAAPDDDAGANEGGETTGGDDGSLGEFERALEDGSVLLEGIEANEDGETSGTILTVRLTNPSTEEILLEFPCGLVFFPEDPSLQPLMMIQPLEIALPVGGSAEVNPYVVCIDVGTSAPPLASSYTVGTITNNADLLTLADCVCREDLSQDLDGMGNVGVQFAAWQIQTGGDIAPYLEEEAGAVSDFMEGSGLGEMAQMLLDMMVQSSAYWLDQCGIEAVGE